MRFTHRRTRFTAWLAASLLVLAAALPSLSQAMVRVQGAAGWVQLCTATGMAWVQVDSALGDTSEPALPAVSGVMVCDGCLLHGGLGSLPPVEGWRFVSGSTGGFFLPHAGPLVVPKQMWSPSRSRAPPTVA